MKKCRLIKDTFIVGLGTIKAGTEYAVDRESHSSVYINLSRRIILKLSRKNVQKIY